MASQKASEKLLRPRKPMDYVKLSGRNSKKTKKTVVKLDQHNYKGLAESIASSFGGNTRGNEVSQDSRGQQLAAGVVHLQNDRGQASASSRPTDPNTGLLPGSSSQKASVGLKGSGTRKQHGELSMDPGLSFQFANFAFNKPEQSSGVNNQGQQMHDSAGMLNAALAECGTGIIGKGKVSDPLVHVSGVNGDIQFVTESIPKCASRSKTPHKKSKSTKVVSTKLSKHSPKGSRLVNVNLDKLLGGVVQDFDCESEGEADGDYVEIESDQEDELQYLERQIKIERKKKELFDLQRSNNVVQRTGADNHEVNFSRARQDNGVQRIDENVVNDATCNLDFRHANLDQLRGVNPLVQAVDQQMRQLGLFSGAGNQGYSADREGGKADNMNFVNSGKMVSGSDEVVSASICKKLVWPQSQLKFGHATKKFKFLDLPSFQLLVAGETACLLNVNMSEAERKARMSLLNETAYLSIRFPWEMIRDFYFTVLIGIERGERTWEQSTLDVQNQVLYIAPDRGTSSSGSGSAANGKGVWKKKEGSTGLKKLWCADFQRGMCGLRGPHEADIKGQRRVVDHICASCIQRGGQVKYHADRDSECPYAMKRNQGPTPSNRSNSWQTPYPLTQWQPQGPGPMNSGHNYRA